MSEPTHSTPALDLHGVTAGYRSDRSPVLDDVTVALARGTLTRLAGDNGTGKTTLLELSSGYLRPWAGRVLVEGHEAHTDAARARRRVCRTQPALYPTMTAAEHLEFASRCAGWPVRKSLERAERYGLDPWLHHEAKELSTGNTRKLWLLMCTLGKFDLVLLDEPMNGLDAHASAILWDEIDRWRATAAVVLVAHHLPSTVVPDQTLDLGHRGRPAAGQAPAWVSVDEEPAPTRGGYGP